MNATLVGFALISATAFAAHQNGGFPLVFERGAPTGCARMGDS